MEGNLNALTTIFTEFYYFVTIVMMFLIHAGFCTYEVGVSRRRNHLKTLLKNAIAIPVVTVTFYSVWLVDLLCVSERTGNHRRTDSGTIRRTLESADGRASFRRQRQ